MSENQPAKMLRICAEDPMWADHAEVSKTLLLRAAAEIERLTAALAAAVAEPVAIHQWRTIGCDDWYDGHPAHGDGGGPYETRTLYAAPAAPPQREPLTDEQIDAIILRLMDTTGANLRNLTRAIERAHGISAPKEQA